MNLRPCMNLYPYLRLLRKEELLGLPLGTMLLVWSGKPSDTWVFYWAVLGVPYYIGFGFAQCWHAPLNQPSFRLLPDARRNLLPFHAASVIGLNIFWGWFLMSWGYPHPAAIAIATGVGTLMLPYEPGLEGLTGGLGAIVRRRYWILGPAGLVAIVFHDKLPAWLQHDSVAAVLGLGLTVWNVLLAHRSHRGPCPEIFLAADPEEPADAMAPAGAIPPRCAGADSIRDWMQAALHERPLRRRLLVAALGSAAVILAYPLLSGFTSGEYPDAWYQLVFEPRPRFWDIGTAGGRVGVLYLGFAPLLLYLFICPEPNFMERLLKVAPPGSHEPAIPRRSRARKAFAVSTLFQAAIVLGTFVGGVILAWLGAWWTGRPFHPGALLDYVIRTLALVPFAVLAGWMALVLAEATGVGAVLGLAGVLIATYLGPGLILSWGRNPGIAICGAAIIMSEFAHYAYLSNYYRRSDLVVRHAS
jgi:hypothetical protein